MFTGKWKNAINQVQNGVVNGSEQLLITQGLLIGILFIYGYYGVRRFLRN